MFIKTYVIKDRLMKFLYLCFILSLILGANDVKASYVYGEDDARMINGVLYDADGAPITGTYQEFYDNNVLKSSTPYINGKRNGVGSQYNQRGVKISDTPYVDGLKEGNALVYYFDGKLKEKIPYVNDKIKDMCEEDKEKNELWTKVFYTKNIKEVESIIYSSFMEF